MMQWAGLALIAMAWAGSGQAATIDDMRAQCALGKDKGMSDGRSPFNLDGVTAVTPQVAKCLVDRFPALVVIAPMRDHRQVPRTVPVPLLAVSPLTSDLEAKAKAAIAELTGGDKARPILVYCHDRDCDLSATAATRLRGWGYSNVLRMRDGLAGWLAAKYPLVPFDQLRNPVGEPAYGLWTRLASDTNYGCFQFKDLDACDQKAVALTKMFEDEALPANLRDVVGRHNFTALATRVEIIREHPRHGGPKAAWAEAQEDLEALRRYASLVARPGALAENAGIVREYAITAYAVGQPEAGDRVVAEARVDARAELRRLDAVRGDKEALAGVHAAMVDMEYMERGVAEAATSRAVDWYERKQPEAAEVWRDRAIGAFDRAAFWNARNDKENLRRLDEPVAGIRMAQMLIGKGGLLQAAGDLPGARRAFGMATAVCGLEDGSDEDIEETCKDAQGKVAATTPASQRWKREQAERELASWLAGLKQ